MRTSPDPLQERDPWSQYVRSSPVTTNPNVSGPGTSPVTSAQEFVNGLTPNVPMPKSQQVGSAFEALGKTTPASPSSSGNAAYPEEWVKKLVEALSGDKRASVPPWSGAPAGLRSWLACGSRRQRLRRQDGGLYSALGEEARRIADVVPPDVLTGEGGYAAVLTTLMARYKPYLEGIGPQSVDSFIYSGDRARGESFASFLSRKEVQKQEMESQLGGAVLNPLVAGRILLRQAGLTEQQQQMIALKTYVLLSYEDVVNALRPLDRLETLSKAAGLPGAVNRTFLQAGDETTAGDDPEEEAEEEDYITESELSDGLLEFEDKEFEEAEAIYVQAYNDVRRDLRSRKKERGYVRHGKQPGTGKKGANKKPKGRGRGFRRDGRGRSKDDARIKGTDAELLARTRCFSCHELGHISANCPKAGGKSNNKKNFVTVGGTSGSSTSTFMMQHHAPRFPPAPATVMRAIYAGVRVHTYEGVVDTAAEEAVVGSQSFNGMIEELRTCGLRPVPVRRPSMQCAGIGGAARLCGAYDVPTSIADVLGILRFTVIEDGAGPDGFVTPSLIPISYLETVGANLDLQHNTYTTADGHSAQMRRLRSGHRAVHIFDFETTPWKLPQKFQVNKYDPFVLEPRSSHSFLGGRGASGVLASADSTSLPVSSSSTLTSSGFPTTVAREDDAGEPMDDALFEAYIEAHVLPGDVVRSPSRSRSASREATTVAYTDTEPPSIRSPTVVGERESPELPAVPEELPAELPELGERRVRVQAPGQPEAQGPELPDREHAELPVASPGEGEESESLTEMTMTSRSGSPRPTRFREPLPEGYEVVFQMQDSRGRLRELERQPGWRRRLPVPNHLIHIPSVSLTHRRHVEAVGMDGRTTMVDDSWVDHPFRTMAHPWHGHVTFYETPFPGRRSSQ